MQDTKPGEERRRILPCLGWREWIELPDLSTHLIKAKVDTGAHNSSLHARDFEFFTREVEGPAGPREREFVRFTTDATHPGPQGRRGADEDSKSGEKPIVGEAVVLDRRAVRSSSGEREVRPVIATRLRLGNVEYIIELNLTDREQMGFRMLIGRQSIHGRFWVDPAASYLAGPRKDREF